MAEPFVLLNRPAAAPASCLRCPRRESLVDVGTDIRSYGRAYLCLYCVSELADVIGLVSRDELEAVQRARRADVADLSDALRKAREITYQVRVADDISIEGFLNDVSARASALVADLTRDAVAADDRPADLPADPAGEPAPAGDGGDGGADGGFDIRALLALDGAGGEGRDDDQVDDEPAGGEGSDGVSDPAGDAKPRRPRRPRG